MPVHQQYLEDELGEADMLQPRQSQGVEGANSEDEGEEYQPLIPCEAKEITSDFVKAKLLEMKLSQVPRIQ